MGTIDEPHTNSGGPPARPWLASLAAWFDRRRRSAGGQVGLLLVGSLVYAVCLAVLRPRFGDSVRALSCLPVLMGAWFWGLRGGLVVCALVFGENLVLSASMGLYQPWGGLRLPLPDPGSPFGVATAFVVAAVVGRMRDLDLRIKAQLAEIRNAEACYRLLFESNPLPMIIFDVESLGIVAVNDAAVDHYGYSAEEFQAKTLYDIRPPEDLPRFRELAAQMPCGLHHAGALRHLKKDGTIIDIEVTSHEVTFLGRHARLSLIIDVTERRHAEELQREYTARLRALSRQLIDVQECERRRLSRELHDEIGQALTALKLSLEGARLGPGTAKDARVAEGLAIIDRTIHQVRSMAVDLRPAMLDDLGLVATLRSYLHRQAGRAGLEAKIVAGTLPARPSPEVETACFRIAQEAVTNVLRYARARSVEVGLRMEGDELVLVVRDDGVGFDAAEARRRARAGESLGLLGMQERVALLGGRLEIDTAPGSGTEIRAWFPAGVPVPA